MKGRGAAADNYLRLPVHTSFSGHSSLIMMELNIENDGPRETGTDADGKDPYTER